MVKETSSGMNLFCYCLNNPVNMADQMGNAPKWLKKAWERAKHNIKTSVRLVKRTVEAVSNSISGRVGVGVGLGGSISSGAMGFSAVAATTNLIEFKSKDFDIVNRSYTTASVGLACFSLDLVNKGKEHSFSDPQCNKHGGVIAGGLDCLANRPIETDGATHLKISFGASVYFLVGGEVGIEMDLHDMAIGVMNVWEEEISNECLYLWSE